MLIQTLNIAYYKRKHKITQKARSSKLPVTPLGLDENLIRPSLGAKVKAPRNDVLSLGSIEPSCWSTLAPTGSWQPGLSPGA